MAESTISQKAENTIIAKINEYAGYTYSYFSEKCIKMNLEGESIASTPVIFGDNKDNFDSTDYYNENFTHIINGENIRWEGIEAIKRFDKGIKIGDDKYLTKITTDDYGLNERYSEDEKNKKFVRFNGCEHGGKKFDLAFPYKDDTLYVYDFYERGYTGDHPSLNWSGKNSIANNSESFDKNIFIGDDEKGSNKRTRNIVVQSFKDIPSKAKLVRQNFIISNEGNDKDFIRDKTIETRGYLRYFSLSFEDANDGNKIYEIGFKINTNKYFYPTVAMPGMLSISPLPMSCRSGDDKPKYACSSYKIERGGDTAEKLENSIIGFYMDSQPNSIADNGVWAEKVDGEKVYPVRYLATSQYCYFKVEIKANTEKDPNQSGGTEKTFNLCGDGLDNAFKRVLVRENEVWKRYDGKLNYENGDTPDAYDINKKTACNYELMPITLLKAGASLQSDTELYKVEYKKVGTKFGSSTDLYVQNGRLYSNNTECVTGDPYEKLGQKLESKFASYSLLEEHECGAGGPIKYFYSCPAAAITYGVGFTWVSRDPNNTTEINLWKKFFEKAMDMGIAIDVQDSAIRVYNNNGASNNDTKLVQDKTGGHIYFKRKSTNELLKSKMRSSNMLPIVEVSADFIDTKLKDVITRNGGYAEQVYNQVIRKIDTVKSTGESISSVPFDSWIGDTSGKYTIRSKITQRQWDYMVDTKYQGNNIDFFDTIRGGRAYDQEGVKVKSYKEFCDRAYNGVVNTEQKIKSGSLEPYFLRNAGWRTSLKEAFSNIPPEEAEKDEDNKKDNTKYYARTITVSCHSLGRGEVETVMSDSDENNDNKNPRAYITYYSKKKIGWFINNNDEDFVYCITSYYEDDSKSDAARTSKLSDDQMDWGRFKQIVNKWSCTIENKNYGEQKLIGVDRYYDMYTGMTPFVQAFFREIDENNKTTWNVLDSVQHPYFKSLVVEDKGVKTVTLTLFDKDFGSYQYGIVVTQQEEEIEKDGKKIKTNTRTPKKMVYSLETLIKKALIQNQSKDTSKKESKVSEEDVSYKDFTEEELKDTYLKYDEYQSADPTNLMVRFGYADDNPSLKDTKYEGYNKKKYGDKGNADLRDFRWYDVMEPGSEKAITVKTETYFNGDEIKQKQDGIKIAASNTQQIDNTKSAEVNEEKKIYEGRDLTTVKSYLRNYMIIGYETTLKPNGMQYTIKAVETGYASLMRKRFLQRYHELTSNPIEVLAALMTIFNEPQEGEPNKKSGFKIYLAKAAEEEKEEAANTLNMLFDFGNLSDEDRETYSWAKDSYTALSNGGLDGKFGREIYKKITVKLGGESALRNMDRAENRGKPALYKSVASLMDEFCAACPSKKFGVANSDIKAHDADGNEIVNDNYESQARLGWFLGKYEGDDVKNNNEQCIVLYYKRPVKLGRIRVYRWGPELPFKTVVKNLSIKNNNEFAILSAVDTLQPDANGVSLRCQINARNMGLIKPDGENDTKLIANNLSVTRDFSDVAQELDNEGAKIVGYVASNQKQANQYDLAFSSCMYTGTMEILGDPSLEFNMLLQPYTYPIRLEVYVPRNELSFKAINWGKNKNNNDLKEGENVRDKIQEFEKDYGARGNIGLHQSHEMSGYYVITSITHNISPSGYTTTLGLSSYPNIERDVLLLNGDKPVQPPYL